MRNRSTPSRNEKKPPAARQVSCVRPSVRFWTMQTAVRAIANCWPWCVAHRTQRGDGGGDERGGLHGELRDRGGGASTTSHQARSPPHSQRPVVAAQAQQSQISHTPYARLASCSSDPARVKESCAHMAPARRERFRHGPTAAPGAEQAQHREDSREVSVAWLEGRSRAARTSVTCARSFRPKGQPPVMWSTCALSSAVIHTRKTAWRAALRRPRLRHCGGELDGPAAAAAARARLRSV